MKFITLIAATLGAVTLSAKTVYVDCQLSDYTGHDGTTPKLALKTIPEATSRAVSGDTIEVAPGVYNEGKVYEDHWWGPCRVYIGKKLYLHATQGPAVTIIEGQVSEQSREGFGTDSLRCLVSEGDSAAESVIEGFTFRHGRACVAKGTMETTDWVAKSGGAVISSSSGNDQLAGPYFVGCVIEDCSAPIYSVAWGGTFVRCRFENNETIASQYFATKSTFVNTIFTHNYSHPVSGTGMGTAHLNCVKLVSCTFANNWSSFYTTTPSYVYNTLFSASNDSQSGTTAETRQNNFTDTLDTRVLMGTATGDLRLRSGQTAANVGDAKFLGTDYLSLPSGEAPFNVDPYIDYYGTTIPNSGTIAVGASQTYGTPVAGVVEILSDRLSLREGIPGCKNSYVYPTNYPVSYRVYFTSVTNEYWRILTYKKELINASGTVSDTFYPFLNDAADVIAPPNLEDVETLKIGISSAEAVRWADPAADPATADGSREHPYPNLQLAVDAAIKAGPNKASGIVVAKAGRYDTGYTNWTLSANYGLQRTRVFLPSSTDCRIVSESGAENTIITGEPDPETHDGYPTGCGSNAVSVLAMRGSAALQGFTITGGYSTEGTGYWSPGRGVIYSYGNDLHVSDCIITNNVGAYAMVGNGRYSRCLVRDNRSGNSGRVFGDGSILISCVVVSNTVPPYGYTVSGAVKVYNCSFANNGVWATFSSTPSALVRNSLNYGMKGDRVMADGDHYGCVYGGNFDSYASAHYLKSDLIYMDPDNYDLRVKTCSPAATAGVKLTDANTDAVANWFLYATTDINGKPIRFNADGSSVAGAIGDTVDGVEIAAVPSGLTMSGATPGFYTNDQLPLSLTYAPVANDPPVTGVAMGGVTNWFATLEGHAYTMTVEKGISREVKASAIYADAWYAAVNGDDLNSGSSPSEPKTIQGALESAGKSVLKLVLAAPGDYASGKMIQTEGSVQRLYSRVVVPNEVTLKSTGGRAVTTIRGLAAATEDPAYSYATSGRGLGADAIRCAYLGYNSKLEGFTLTDGRTRRLLDSGSESHCHVETSGGGVYGVSTTASVVEDCFITNCVAFRGGGAYCVTLRNSILAGNHASFAGGNSESARAFGSLSYGGNSDYPHRADQKANYDVREIDHSTILDACYFVNGNYRNSLVYRPFFSKHNGDHFTNCLFLASGIIKTYGSYTNDEEFFEAAYNTRSVANGELNYDADFRPTIGENAGIDQGFVEAVNLGDTDVLGGQRIYNRLADLGALEADWRSTYSRDLHKNQVTVVGASPAVKATATQSLELIDGATMLIKLGCANLDFAFDAKVTDGTLSVKVGETLTEYTADANIAVTVPTLDTEITLSYAGTGSAEIGKWMFQGGIVIILQ